MIKFNSESFGHTVQMVAEGDGGETWMEITEVYQRFLEACGYVFDKKFDMATILHNEHERLLEKRAKKRAKKSPFRYEED